MKKLFGIGYYHFKELGIKGYSLDSLFILTLVNEGVDLQQLDEKSQLLGKGLERKNLIINNKITQLGLELLDFCNSRATKLKITKSKDEDFEKWWDEIYPATNYFEYSGKTFKGIQKKKVNGVQCRALFNKYVTTGEFTAEDIIGATNFHIQLAKKESFTTGKNQLSFISNSHTYLLQKMFEPFIALYKTEQKKVEEPRGEFYA